MTPWNFFSKIYVISLNTRTDRREHIKNEFSKLTGLNNRYSFFDAIYGKESKYMLEYAKKRNIIKESNNMNLGQIGCILSHYLLWERCYLEIHSTNENEWILVFEDDVEFHPDFTNEKFDEYLKNLPDDAEFFKLCYLGVNGFCAIENNPHWYSFSGAVYSTMAYAVKRKYLKNLLKTYENPLDWYVFDKHAYGMAPHNQNDEWFKVKRYFFHGGNVYQNEEFYRGVGRSYQLEKDSDIDECVILLRENKLI